MFIVILITLNTTIKMYQAPPPFLEKIDSNVKVQIMGGFAIKLRIAKSDHIEAIHHRFT